MTIPECSGEAWIGCKAKLEELELIPERHEFTWETAKIELKRDTVTELAPVPKTHVEPKTKVVVTTNPPAEKMPVLIPKPESCETYAHYAARLNPALVPERHDLEAAYVEPADGPNAVESVEPAPETRADPAAKTTVRVTTNPADVPIPAGGWVPPSIEGIETGPLGLSDVCGVFPFGLFCWIGGAFSEIGEAESTCPSFNPHLPSILGGEEKGAEIDFCEEPMLEIREIMRPVELFLFVLGLGWVFAKASRHFGSDDG
ncbi:MAG: hypothetical protein WAN65_10175 [Candidatus Sulfotelmatobacter sp.]